MNNIRSDTLVAALDAHARDRCNCKPLHDGLHDRCVVMLAAERIRALEAKLQRYTANKGNTGEAG